MGFPMANCLLKANVDLTVYDIANEACSALEANGAKVAATPAEAVVKADIIILMLPTINTVLAVLQDDQGALAAAPADATFINMSTVSPAQNRALARDVVATGRRFVEAPVARGPDHATTGELSILSGGKSAECEAVLPVLSILGESIRYCGDVGAASALKLATNYLGMASNVAAAEALTFAKAHGVEESDTIEFMMQTAAGKGYLGVVYPNKVLADDLTPGFPVELALKDLKLAQEAGAKIGLDLTIGNAMRPHYENEVSQGRGRLDLTVVYRSIGTSLNHRN